MNMDNKLKIAVIVVAVALLTFTMLTLASWQQTISWNRGEIITFTVDESTSITVTNPEIPFTQTYHIHNTGNVAIRVTGSVTFPSGSATVAWNPAVGYIDIVNKAEGTIDLTLSDFNVGTGSATVTFDSAAV